MNYKVSFKILIVLCTFLIFFPSITASSVATATQPLAVFAEYKIKRTAWEACQDPVQKKQLGEEMVELQLRAHKEKKALTSDQVTWIPNTKFKKQFLSNIDAGIYYSREKQRCEQQLQEAQQISPSPRVDKRKLIWGLEKDIQRCSIHLSQLSSHDRTIIAQIIADNDRILLETALRSSGGQPQNQAQ